MCYIADLLVTYLGSLGGAGAAVVAASPADPYPSGDGEPWHCASPGPSVDPSADPSVGPWGNPHPAAVVGPEE